MKAKWRPLKGQTATFTIQVSSPWCIIHLAFLLLLPLTAYADLDGTPQTISSYSPRVLGEIEGCFNYMEPLLSIQMSDDLEISNAGCQQICSEQGFSVAATVRRTCLCGNSLPSIFHKVQDTNCDLPCSRDQDFCSKGACCGSFDEKFFTVSFAGEMDSQKQVLRRLSYAYRYKNPEFRLYIASLLQQATALKVIHPSVNAASSMSSNNVAANQSTVGFFGMGGGCPTQWKAYGDSCFRKITSKAMNFDSAQSACMSFGGSLAVINSQSHNDGVKQLLGGSTAWVGLATEVIDTQLTWGWDMFTDWDESSGQPDLQGRAGKGPSFGPFSGGSFDDYRPDLVGVFTITIGYTSTSIVYIQAKYNTTQGTVVKGQAHGSLNKVGLEKPATQTITLYTGDNIVNMKGAATKTALQSLQFKVRSAQGLTTTYGPYGSTTNSLGMSQSSSFTYTPDNTVLALYGRTDDKVIYQVGFYEYEAKACVVLSDMGHWQTVFCDDKYGAPFWVCERGATDKGLLECPVGWQNFGTSSCVAAFRGADMSWNDAQANCSAQQSHLATVDSLPIEQAYWGLMQQGTGFVGLHNVGKIGSPRWVWDRYENWADGEPSVPPAGSATSTCVRVDGATKLWSTIDCQAENTVAVICEKDLVLTAASSKCTCPAGWTSFSCSCYLVVQMAVTPISWLDAQTSCGYQGAHLVSITTAAENNFVTTTLLAGTASAYLFMRDLFRSGYIESLPYLNWGGGSEPARSVATCGAMKKDGFWYSYPCGTSPINAGICRIPMAGAEAYVGNSQDQYEIQMVDESQLDYGVPLDVRIYRVNTSDYLMVDEIGNVVGTQDGLSSPASVFNLNVLEPGKNLFAIKNTYYNSYLTSDVSSKTLKAVALPKNTLDDTLYSEATAFSKGIISAFSATTMVPAIAYQNLQMSITSVGSRSPDPLLCSVFVYDLTPGTDSYTCYTVKGDLSELPYVSLEVSAWLIMDKTYMLTPRVPLDFSRMVCENTDSKNSLTCTSLYGEGVSYTSTESVTVGVEIWNSFLVQWDSSLAGLTDPDDYEVYYNFVGIISNSYSDSVQQVYTATNVYTASFPVPPLNTLVVQYWSTTVNVDYVWNLILSAVGSFQLSTLGLNLGPPRSVTQVLDLEELFFYGWGRYTFPDQGTVIITVDNIESAKYNFCGDPSGEPKASCIPPMGNAEDTSKP